MGTKVKLFEVNEEKMKAIEKAIPEKIKLVRNIMKTHQIAVNTEVSVGGPCSGNSTKDVPSEKSLLKPVDVVNESLVGKYCMLHYVYDGLSYQWIILSVDKDSVEVKTMSRIGRNRWFWPMRDDKLWYDKSQSKHFLMKSQYM